MNAKEYAASIPCPVLWYTSVAIPLGTDLPVAAEIDFPFALEEILGEVDDGTFRANNLNDGTGLHGWQFTDVAGSAVVSLTIQNKPKRHADLLREIAEE